MKKIIAEAKFSNEQLKKIDALEEETGLCGATLRILYGRGIDTADKIEAFIRPGKHRFLNPMLMSGMREAVELITRACAEQWSVVVYGDYDADGVCASTILGRALADFGVYATVYVPERTGGYGLSERAIDEIFEEECPQLFITVDCGISNAREVEYIKEQGAEVIVTDHHELPDILPDCICINPKISDDYPYDNLCGAGVAFKLACALNGRDAYKYLDFAAIATVADSVPLTGENRDIVAEGLELMNSSPRKNYSAFFKRDDRVTSQTLAFSVAPKINAAGRMGDARSALNLFLSDDEREIYDYSVKLTAYNVERQKYCDELYLSAKSLLQEKGAHGRVIVLCGENWNAGFVGIVAARLAEEYCRPALLFVRHGDKVKGSARSIDGVNIFEALKACDYLIEEFGGHSQAAGVNLTADNMDALEDALNEYLHANYSQQAFTPTHYINGEFSSPLSQKFLRELSLLEPFGVGNRRPQFAIEVGACRVRPLKEGSPHLSVKYAWLDMVYFSGVKNEKLLRSGLPKYMIYDYVVSSFRGREQFSGYIRDVVYDGAEYTKAKDSTALNSLSLIACDAVDCTVEKITKIRAQQLMDEGGEYGTAFIAVWADTLKKYDLRGLEINLFNLAAGNLSNVILLSPTPDCDLSGYERVVYLDDPVRITQPSLAGKKVLAVSEIDGSARLSKLSTEREDLVSIFKYISANELTGDSLEEIAQKSIAQTVEVCTQPLQALFALKVFEQLGLIEFSAGRINVIKGAKTQLTNSEIYNFIRNLNV